MYITFQRRNVFRFFDSVFATTQRTQKRLFDVFKEYMPCKCSERIIFSYTSPVVFLVTIIIYGLYI